MSIHRHAAGILATDGVTGLIRRGVAKAYRTLTGQRHPGLIRHEAEQKRIEEARAREAAKAAREETEVARARVAYPVLVDTFHEEVRRRNLGNIDGFYWYHSIDLGNGLVTPGDYDFRDRISDYPFPADMSGMTALDVGSATGFFAFEFERRGADVTSVDLPSINDWDLIWSDRAVLIPEMLEGHGVSTVAELDRVHMHGPFSFCHRLRNSRVKRCLSRIYDLTPEKLGRDQFDFMFLGDILGHLFSPLAALNALAPLCRRQMVISLGLARIDLRKPEPCLYYGGGESREGDGRSWMPPNWEALRQMLLRVGFRKVECVGESRVLVRRAWQWLDREMIVATK
jgi:tRNA (mo5U34)-methyltransferase